MCTRPCARFCRGRKVATCAVDRPLSTRKRRLAGPRRIYYTHHASAIHSLPGRKHDDILSVVLVRPFFPRSFFESNEKNLLVCYKIRDYDVHIKTIFFFNTYHIISCLYSQGVCPVVHHCNNTILLYIVFTKNNYSVKFSRRNVPTRKYIIHYSLVAHNIGAFSTNQNI